MARSGWSWSAAVVIAAGMLAIGCGGGGGGGGDDGPPVIVRQSTCTTPGGRLTAGEYIVENNTYPDSEAAQPAHPIAAGGFSQCAELAPGTHAGLEVSWTWSWPKPTVAAEAITRATPSVIYGFKPWDPRSTTSSLPALVSKVASLTVDAEVQQAVGADSMADFGVIAYLTTADHKTGTSPLPYAKRFFIYRNRYPAVTHTDVTASNVQIDGIGWDVVSSSGLVLYTPHADSSVSATSLHLDVAHFLADALARGLIQSSWYLSSVETANVLYWGQGSLKLDDYEDKARVK